MAQSPSYQAPSGWTPSPHCTHHAPATSWDVGVPTGAASFPPRALTARRSLQSGSSARIWVVTLCLYCPEPLRPGRQPGKASRLFQNLGQGPWRKCTQERRDALHWKLCFLKQSVLGDYPLGKFKKKNQDVFPLSWVKRRRNLIWIDSPPRGLMSGKSPPREGAGT